MVEEIKRKIAPVLMLAAVVLAAPAAADTVGPGDFPVWPLDCGLETLRINDFPVPTILTSVLPGPVEMLLSVPPVGVYRQTEPMPAPVTIAAVGWLSAVVIAALALAKSKGKG